MSDFLKKRLERLESHMQAENPALLEVLPTFYKFDKMLYRIGLLDRDSSLASRISWWPLISILGTFSSGKSTFINDYIGEKIQDTGNQAVDDKFTVICHRSAGVGGNRTLPGSALDADPRFPFFRISREIEKVAQGEGKHIESYLQLRTTAKDRIKGKILIDSPGFDADDQRRSTLRITDHIIDLSDMVLVFFDARHPEPGAMQDTLEHLVANTVSRTDASKFYYVLNQIDTAAKEDNPEDITGAWQRAVAQAGLGAGQFFTIYNEEAAIPIEDEGLRERFQAKRDQDLKRIVARMDEVDLQRNYRIVGVLETVANEMEHDIIPQLAKAKARWRRGVLLGDGAALAVVLLVVGAAMIRFGWLPPADVFSFQWIGDNLLNVVVGALAIVILAGSFHYWIRGFVAKRITASLPEAYGHVELNLKKAFLKSAGTFRSIFRADPVGWGKRDRKQLRNIRETVANHIQELNDRYADPSGKTALAAPAPVAKTPASEARAPETADKGDKAVEESAAIA